MIPSRFTLHAPRFTGDLSLPRLCADACAQSYRAATIETDLAHVLKLDTDRGTILAFRGTDSIRDWLIDARVERTDLGFASVHSGFWRSVNSIFPQILIFDQRSCPTPVILTGHSKGGAEAKLCAFLLARAGRPITAVVTFGAPRAGDSRWRILYNATPNNFAFPQSTLGSITQRWIHEEDIVPRLPVWVTGYRHIAQEYFMSTFGGVEVNPPLWHKAISDLWGTFCGYKRRDIEQLIDHPISRYQEHLNTL